MPTLRIQEPLKALGLGGDVKPLRTMTSAVTTRWGVAWNEDAIARDLMQNFYDANRTQIDKIIVAADEKTGIVEVSAPVELPLDRLFYFASDKGDEDVGKYGEGFKVAVLCLLRDHDVEPVVVSGSEVVHIHLSADKIAATKSRSMEYDFYKLAESSNGTRLILPGCKDRLIDAMQSGLHHFFYDGNPLIGKRLWQSGDRQFSIYRSATPLGGVAFYRNLKRGDIPTIPVVLAINGEQKTLEKKIQNDRDRNAFGDELMKIFYAAFCKGLKYDAPGKKAILELSRPCWESGHGLLSATAASTMSHERSQLTSIFGDRYFAHSKSPDIQEQIRYNQVVNEWLKQDRKELPGYFASFGVVSASSHLDEIDTQAKLEARSQLSRPPSDAERQAIGFLTTTAKELEPVIMQYFQNRTTTYTVVQTEALLGQLKETTQYRASEVCFAEQVFEADFPFAFSVFLHEHAHVVGFDGSRAFTDALTHLIEVAIRERKIFDHRENQWEEIRRRVCQERTNAKKAASPASHGELLKDLQEPELRRLLTRVPVLMLKRLLSDEKHDRKSSDSNGFDS